MDLRGNFNESQASKSNNESLTSGYSSTYKENLIANSYLIGRRFANGNFGQVHYGKDIHSGKTVSIKLERANARIPQLKAEYCFYRKLGSSIGFPAVYYYDSIKSYNLMIMELLGPNLEALFMKSSRKFSTKTVCLIAIQLIRRFEFIHSKGIVYRDVKPENFLIGRKNDDAVTIYVVDFGLAKEYIDPITNEHIPFRDHKNLTGTARYMSVNTHLGIEQSRRDDMEALGYMFIYLTRGALPWQGLKGESASERYRKIGETKRSISMDSLCSNIPEQFISYMDYVKRLEYYDQPDYDFLSGLFEDIAQKCNVVLDQKFDWVGRDSVHDSLSIKSSIKPLESPFENYCKEFECDSNEASDVNVFMTRNDKQNRNKTRNFNSDDPRSHMPDSRYERGHCRKPTPNKIYPTSLGKDVSQIVLPDGTVIVLDSRFRYIKNKFRALKNLILSCFCRRPRVESR